MFLYYHEGFSNKYPILGSGDTSQKFSMGPLALKNHTTRRAFLYAGQRKSEIAHGVEVNYVSGHRSVRFLKLHRSERVEFTRSIADKSRLTAYPSLTFLNSRFGV